MRKYPATVLALVVAVLLQLHHLDVAAGEDLSEYLWTQTATYHKAALQSTYIQGLVKVSLDPTEFGAYNVQDAIYCYKAKGSIDHAVSRTTDPDLKQFLQKTSGEYKKAYESAFNDWHIQDQEGISLGSAIENYVNHLDNVAKTMEPIYLVAALIPCAKLWPWLGEQIEAESGKFGVYNKWVASSLNPKSISYKEYEKQIDKALTKGTIEKEKALEAYRLSMKGEVDFFNSVSLENYGNIHDEF